MNPLELAQKIRAVIADYDSNTATTALEIAKLLVQHRIVAELAFNQDMLSRHSDADARQAD
jgi:hypothetical protein